MQIIIQKYLLVDDRSRVLYIEFSGLFKTIFSKFNGTSRNVGVFQICLHLGLGVGLTGKVEVK